MGTEKTRSASGGARRPHESGPAQAPDKAPAGRRGRFTDALRARGQPLPPELRAQMQGRFARDFSHVRIHADDRAGAVADAVGANAFTAENHIVFGTGKYDPDSAAGRRLIAHELTHVAQQQPLARDVSLVAAMNSLRVGPAPATAEREAAAAAERVVRGETVTVRERAQGRLQADLVGAGVGALVGGAFGAIAGGIIGGPLGALIGGGIGLLAGALIGGLTHSKFPSYRQIIGDGDVQSRISSAWSSTEAAANATSRREEGFWIRLNKGTGKYEFTSTIIGSSSGPTSGASVVLGARPADSNPGTDTAIYTVASFHTHTPTAFRPVGRPVGPSDADHAADKSDDVVGVVYDYVASPRGSGNIPAGHPIGSAARPYHSGPNHRQKE